MASSARCIGKDQITSHNHFGHRFDNRPVSSRKRTDDRAPLGATTPRRHHDLNPAYAARYAKIPTRNRHNDAVDDLPDMSEIDRPGFVITVGDAPLFMPCPTCDGSRIASCCDGAVPCDEDVVDQRAAINDT